MAEEVLYRSGIQESSSGSFLPIISVKQGKPSLLPNDPDQKLCIFINSTRTARGEDRIEVTSQSIVAIWILWLYERIVPVILRRKTEIDS